MPDPDMLGPDIPVYVSLPDPDEAGGSMGVVSSLVRDPRLVSLSPAQLRDNLAAAIASLREVFASPPDVEVDDGSLHLTEIQVSLEITASGKMALLGSGAEVSTTGAIQLTFTR